MSISFANCWDLKKKKNTKPVFKFHSWMSFDAFLVGRYNKSPGLLS